MVEIVGRIVNHPDLFHDPSGPEIGGNCERHKSIEFQTIGLDHTVVCSPTGVMSRRKAAWRLGAAGLVLTSLFAFQKPFRVYPSMEPYDDIPVPPDWQEKTEWVFARLMYPQHPFARF